MVELQRTVQRGNTLLRRKEEQLQQLESSLAEEVRGRTRHLTVHAVTMILHFRLSQLL